MHIGRKIAYCEYGDPELAEFFQADVKTAFVQGVRGPNEIFDLIAEPSTQQQ